MTKPWLWNTVLALALLLAATKLFSALTASLPPIPRQESVAERTVPVPALRPAPTEETYAEIADRDLFSAGRGRAAPPKAESTTPAAPAPADAPKATLFGIVMDDGGEKYAYLTDDAASQRGRAKRYREGDAFSGGTVKEILADRVIITSGQSDHTFALRAPKSGIKASQPPAPAAPAAAAPAPARSRRPVPQVRTRRQSLEESRRTRRVPARRRATERPADDFREGYDDYREGDFPGDGEDLYYEDDHFQDDFGEAWEDDEREW